MIIRMSIVSWFAALMVAVVSAEPVKTILDADRLTDSDDVGVLTCLHAIADAGEQGEYENVIHPGNDDGSGFWNVNSIWFMYAPAFPFKTIAGAKEYRFTITDSCGSNLVFTAGKPTASLSPVWEKVPVDNVVCICEGIGLNGEVLGRAGERKFWRQAPFTLGKYPKKAKSYRDCAKGIYEYIFNGKGARTILATGKFDMSDPICSYASKYGASLINGMIHYANAEPANKEESLLIAKKTAEFLIDSAEKPGTPIEYFPQTYQGVGEGAGKRYAGQHMLIYPAQVASSFVKLSNATGEPRWLDFAEKIASTYIKLQGEDGTWYLKLYAADGKPVNPNRLLPFAVIDMFEALFAATGKAEYRAAADKGFQYVYSTRMQDWNWEGQFEDIAPTAKYKNLTKHPACDMALCLAKRFPGDMKHLAEMRELLRFAEDQFVCWEKPNHGGKNLKGDTWGASYDKWFTPCALEQYFCYWPIDASARKLIITYLALYRAEGRKIDLEKAKALGDTMTRIQRSDGSLPTWWWTSGPGVDWLNCMLASASALEELEEMITYANVKEVR